MQIGIREKFVYFKVVSKKDGVITYDWTGLDHAVNQILATGAKPFLSLSLAGTSLLKLSCDCVLSSFFKDTILNYIKAKKFHLFTPFMV